MCIPVEDQNIDPTFSSSEKFKRYTAYKTVQDLQFGLLPSHSYLYKEKGGKVLMFNPPNTL